jgi:hypothetical protein
VEFYKAVEERIEDIEKTIAKNKNQKLGSPTKVNTHPE